jgi:hypothetical protein
MPNQKRRPGRPTVAGKEGEKSVLGIRATATMKRRLQEAADVSGRSLSAEAEYRLERSFSVEDALSGPARPVLLHLISAFGGESDPRDPEGYRESMMRAVAAMTDRFPGGLSPAEWDVIAAGLRRRIAAAHDDRETILSVWNEVRRPAGEGTKSQARRRKA